MIDILVKSFNRPYYLDRCLKSIQMNVKGSYSITILDDGTLEKYIEKLQIIYPDVHFKFSEYYDLKIRRIEDHLANKEVFQHSENPLHLWQQSVASSTDFILWLEEDNWFKQPFKIDEAVGLMKSEQLQLLKMCWNGNPQTVQGEKEFLSNDFEKIDPNMPKLPNWFLTSYFENKFKLRSFLDRIGQRIALPYYTLYATSGAIFDKSYWSYLWKDADNVFNEFKQLKNAVAYWNSRDMKVGKPKSEVISTSFLTASTNRFSIKNSDMIKVNSAFNEAWFHDQMDVLNNLPDDFDVSYLSRFLNHDKQLLNGWKEWIKMFARIHNQPSIKSE